MHLVSLSKVNEASAHVFQEEAHPMEQPEDSSIMRVVKKIAKTKLSSLAIHKLEQLANKVGVEEKELFELYVEAKNRAQLDSFASTPYNERIVLLPQCLRAKDCPAEIGKYGYECKQCGKCSIANIIKTTKQLGYKGTFVMPGGSLAKTIMVDLKPKASLGVACSKELVMGSYLCEKVGVIGQGVQLLKDGCINTVVDLKTLKEALKVNTF
ncbi:MAG: hypothetical protein CW716_06535 [Candidatus Bathyarchaeum sp.]|nr:MAG: hypothetical protein CW716_06535 [Candidatus Bathyarchaeum sp.]